MKTLQEILNEITKQKFAKPEFSNRISKAIQNEEFKVKRLETLYLGRIVGSKIVTCPNCGCVGPKLGMSTNHFDKCRRTKGMSDHEIYKLKQKRMSMKEISKITNLKIPTLYDVLKKYKKNLLVSK
jgi:hypothetical protein